MCSHISTAGVSVNVKSRFGLWDAGSLKTFVSMPALLSESVGVRASGPAWNFAAAAGSSEGGGWADARAGAIDTQKTTSALVDIIETGADARGSRATIASSCTG